VCASGTTARAVTSAAPYRLIFANILLSALTRLAAPLRGLTEPGARIVFSALLPNHANAALAIYRAQGLVLEKRITLDGWVTLVMHRKTKPPRAGKPGRVRRGKRLNHSRKACRRSRRRPCLRYSRRAISR